MSPACRRIALDEREMTFKAVNVFEAHLELKDRAQLQLPPLLLEPLVREDAVLAGSFYDCKARLNVLCGGLSCMPMGVWRTILHCHIAILPYCHAAI